MLADIEDDKIDTVLVKDMSRVGRNYLQTGFYTEVYFKKKAILQAVCQEATIDRKAFAKNLRMALSETRGRVPALRKLLRQNAGKDD